MVNCRLVLHRLSVDREDLPLRFGTLVVVQRPAGALDWEIVVDCLESPGIGPGRVTVELLVVDGASVEGRPTLAELEGEAVVVRRVGTTLVLRGDSDLDGFDRDLLEP